MTTTFIAVIGNFDPTANEGASYHKERTPILNWLTA
jgi:hypothetical protein